MQPGKKMLQAALVLGFGAMLLAPVSGQAMDADDAPDEIEIDSMANLYEPVTFDHASHTEMAECFDCHHHTTGTGPTSPTCAKCHDGKDEGDTFSCSECHEADPFSDESLKFRDDPTLHHIDKPGLKGAYHLNCIGCHQEVDGPTECQDCHAMTKAGEKMFNTGKYAPAGGGKKAAH